MQLVDIDAKTDRGAQLSHRESTAPTTLWQSERFRSILVICVVVLVANGTYLTHIFEPNPINQVSGLGSVVEPGLLAGQNNIDPNIGFLSQALGHRAALDWLHGQIPWWNPFEGVGTPLAGEMQSAAFFPLVLLNLLSGGQIYFRLVLEILAGVGTYVLLRRFTHSNLPAVVGGIGFALNGTFSWLFHAPGNPIAFLPFLVLGFEWAREGALNGDRKGWVLIAVSGALAFYAGFPEVAFIDGLLACLWLIVRAVGMPRQALATFVKNVLLGVVVGLLLSAPILVAFVTYLPHADVGPHSGALAMGSLSANTALPVQIMPYVFGPIFGFTTKDPQQLIDFWGNIGGYLGASLSMLAMIGVAGRRFRILRIALALWIVIGLARLVGVHWALDLINMIPGVRFTAFYRYAPPSWEFALVVLAALGLDDVIRRKTPKWIVIASGTLMIALCLLCWRVAQPVFDALVGASHNRVWALSSFAWTLATIAGVAGLALVIASLSAGEKAIRLLVLVLSSLVVLDVVVMFATPQFSAPRHAFVDTKPVAYLQKHMGESRFFTLGPLSPNYGSYFGVSSLAVNDAEIPKQFEALIRHHLDTNVDPLNFTGVTTNDPAGPTPAQEFVDHLSAYEAVGVKYVLLPRGMKLPLSRGVTLPKVFNDGTTTILRLPKPAPLFESYRSTCFVQAKSVTAVAVNCRRPSIITYREQYIPGSYAEAEGFRLPVHSDEMGFQSVVVPAGKYSVELGFTPPYAALAIAAFVLGLALLVVACLAARFAHGGRRGSNTAVSSGASSVTRPDGEKHSRSRPGS